MYRLFKYPEKHFDINNMYDLFKNISVELIVSFVKRNWNIFQNLNFLY